MVVRTHFLSECLKAADEFKRTKKRHRPAPMPPNQTHFLSYKPHFLSYKPVFLARLRARQTKVFKNKKAALMSGFGIQVVRREGFEPPTY